MLSLWLPLRRPGEGGSLKELEERKEERKRLPTFFVSVYQPVCGWGMGSNTTAAAAAAEQKPHEVPNGWMKKLPAATEKL